MHKADIYDDKSVILFDLYDWVNFDRRNEIFVPNHFIGARSLVSYHFPP